MANTAADMETDRAQVLCEKCTQGIVFIAGILNLTGGLPLADCFERRNINQVFECGRSVAAGPSYQFEFVSRLETFGENREDQSPYQR